PDPHLRRVRFRPGADPVGEGSRIGATAVDSAAAEAGLAVPAAGIAALGGVAAAVAVTDTRLALAVDGAAAVVRRPGTDSGAEFGDEGARDGVHGGYLKAR